MGMLHVFLLQPECTLPELTLTSRNSFPWMWVWRPPPSSFCYLSCPARTTLMTSAVKTQRAYGSPPTLRPVLRQIPGGPSWWGGDLRSWGLGRGAGIQMLFFPRELNNFKVHLGERLISDLLQLRFALCNCMSTVCLSKPAWEWKFVLFFCAYPSDCVYATRRWKNLGNIFEEEEREQAGCERGE